MNMRKTLLLVLILAIASLGLTLTGCEKKSDQPTGVQPAPTEQPAEQPTEKPAPAEHPTEHPTGEHPQ